MAANAFNENEATTFTEFTVPKLVRLNGWPEELSPKLVYSPIQRIPSLQEVMQAVATLTGAGARLFPDVAAENKFRADLGLPQLPEDEPEEPEANGDGGKPRELPEPKSERTEKRRARQRRS
jgi:hypothetical protein